MRAMDVRIRLATKSSSAQAPLALDDGTHGAVLKLDDLGDLGQSADLVELGLLVDVFVVGLRAG